MEQQIAEVINEYEYVENVMDYMIRVRDILMSNSDELPDFCRDFLIDLQRHIENNCEHHWVDDSIDVSFGERSIPIRYCVRCYSCAQPPKN